MKHRIHEIDDQEIWAEACASLLASGLERAVERKGEALLAAAGGSTPAPILTRLASRPLPWSAITIIPTDDRCVHDAHPHRNLAMLAASMAMALALGARIRSLEQMGDQDIRPDAVLLGFGLDAHIASIFPAGDGMADAMDPAGPSRMLRTTPDPLPAEAPHPRVTLSASALLAAPLTVVASAGEAKREVLAEAISAHAPRTPLARFLALAGPRAHLLWTE